ncbi:hypothetical protein PV682_11295 [Streptomyces niveiscabiei]|uniref:hypothetical protein n=1 Tax=Streptomyces niveiscabiei TaxID=164115 RepID=UPI0029A32F7C|nr:hypothetical protein [Streptomyces niveiscabiei]MDX3382037.1 hypothetical protein [Streptomyces niveiscabiei]
MRDVRLDPYRRGAARLFTDGREVGLLVTRVDVWREYTGWLWRRRVTSEQELPEWMVWPVGSSGTLVPEDDVVRGEDVDRELADWSAGRFRLRDTVYEARWLPVSEAEPAHREHGWDAV